MSVQKTHCLYLEIARIIEDLGYKKTQDDEGIVVWERDDHDSIDYIPYESVFEWNDFLDINPYMMKELLRNIINLRNEKLIREHNEQNKVFKIPEDIIHE